MQRPKLIFVFSTTNAQIALAQQISNLLHSVQISHNVQYLAPMCITIKVIPRQSNNAIYVISNAGIILPAPISAQGKRRQQIQYVFGL